MTNNKLKPHNIQYGIMKRDVVNANGKVLLTAMCCLRKMGISVKSLVEMFNAYAYGTVKQWRQNFDDDVFDKKFAKELERIHISENELTPIVMKIIGKLPVGSTTKTFTTELAMFCTHINRYFGYGKTRLMRMLTLMTEYNGDCLEELKEAGITFTGFDEYIFTEKEERKTRASKEELYRLAMGREALRTIQEERNGENDLQSKSGNTFLTGRAEPSRRKDF